MTSLITAKIKWTNIMTPFKNVGILLVNFYEQQRDLIKQKLENVLSYYSDMDSYLSSITSKLESLISLNDEMGKRSSLTELVEQFASLSDQINSTTQKKLFQESLLQKVLLVIQRKLLMQLIVTDRN